MDNEYNYGNNEEKREEPARIEPPVPEDGIIEEAAQTEQRTEQENTSYYEKPPVYESSTQESQTRDSQSYDSQSYDSQTYGAPTYEQPDEESKKQPRRHMRKEKERKPIHIGVKWATCICMALVFGLLASAAFQASNLVINKVVGNKLRSHHPDRRMIHKSIDEYEFRCRFRSCGYGGKCNAVSCINYKFKCTAGTGFLWRCS